MEHTVRMLMAPTHLKARDYFPGFDPPISLFPSVSFLIFPLFLFLCVCMQNRDVYFCADVKVSCVFAEYPCCENGLKMSCWELTHDAG